MNLEIDDRHIYTINECQRRAADRAVNELLNEKTRVIGIGNGKTAMYVTKRIIARYKKELRLSELVFIPNSHGAAELLLQHDMPISDLNIYPEIDITFDGVNEIDYGLNAIKGSDGALLRNKLFASFSKNYVVITDYSKLSNRLGSQYCNDIPIEVCKTSYKPIQMRLKALLGGEFNLRMAEAMDNPLLSDSKSYILEWRMPPGRKHNWEWIYETIKTVPGVIECGIWASEISQAYIGMANGVVKQIKRNHLSIAY